MKIVFTNDTIYGYASGTPVAGGAERQQWLLARALAATGWAVTVGVHEALKVGERRTIDGVEFLGIGRGYIGIGRDHIHLVWYRFLSSEQPDWWYWRCADHLLGSAVEVAKLARVRTIFAAGFDTDVQPRRALFRRSHWWPLYAWGLSRTDRIFVQHTGQLAELAPRWRPKAYIVPSIAGEMAAVKPHSERAQYVAWVAMLRQPKRPDVLLEIAHKTPAIRFVVCGGPTPFASPPGYGEWIVEALQAQPNIEFLGQVAPQKTQQIIADAAMLLSTSDAEGFPNTFLEAWSSGTPVISLKLDPDRIIEREGLGTVPGTVERAIADILALMESPQRRDAIAARARRYVADTHSAAAVATVFEKAIAGVLS
jgi:glycosyltransferase involved in cell wall biosynthesis